MTWRATATWAEAASCIALAGGFSKLFSASPTVFIQPSSSLSVVQRTAHKRCWMIRFSVYLFAIKIL